MTRGRYRQQQVAEDRIYSVCFVAVMQAMLMLRSVVGGVYGTARLLDVASVMEVS